jgi:hypothetical protein
MIISNVVLTALFLSINIYGVEMLLYDNSVLKMYLLNAQLNVHVRSLTFSYEYFIFFICLVKTICRKHTTIFFLIHGLSHNIPAITPRQMSARDAVEGL